MRDAQVVRNLVVQISLQRQIDSRVDQTTKRQSRSANGGGAPYGLAKGEVGIRENKPVPTLAEFCEKRFAPWVESTISLKTWRDFYKVGLLAIQAY